MIRLAKESDSAALARIYNHYVENTFVTFEESPLSSDSMRQWLKSVNQAHPWFVFEDEEGKILGSSYASAWKGRCAYRHSAETSVYLDPEATGRGVGSQLYQTLIDNLKSRSFHTLIGGIALPNESSVALHEKFGFTKVAHFKEVGRKFETWIDVGYWQLNFPQPVSN